MVKASACLADVFSPRGFESHMCRWTLQRSATSAQTSPSLLPHRYAVNIDRHLFGLLTPSVRVCQDEIGIAARLVNAVQVHIWGHVPAAPPQSVKPSTYRVRVGRILHHPVYVTRVWVVRNGALCVGCAFVHASSRGWFVQWCVFGVVASAARSGRYAILM